VYHSAYDTFEHHSRFVDPGFVYDSLLAQTIGRLVLRLADTPAPPQREAGFADDVGMYLGQVKKLADTERQEAAARAALLADHAFQLAADPTKPGRPPPALSEVPYLEWAPLENAVTRLRQSAKAYDAAVAPPPADLRPDRLAKWQSIMLTIDQTLAAETGLPGRPWYKNLVYAPGRLTGYGAKTLPGVREAIEERRWDEANRYVRLTADALDAYSARLDEARLVVAGK
jgi:N-acetylated-alpha-linked acidic dipeptidase